ncbi:MAG: hypothetical protein HKN54_11735 [Flavobacteriaceae bacterium]|nr:hypothetical protein [Flavobacteriaceae bacterium]
MQIFDLAYHGKDQEKQITKLNQKKEHLTYAILTIKSANNLGFEMLDDDSNMQFVDPKNIVHISSAQNIDENSDSADTQLSSVSKNPLLNILSFASRAEARIQD